LHKTYFRWGQPRWREHLKERQGKNFVPFRLKKGGKPEEPTHEKGGW